MTRDDPVSAFADGVSSPLGGVAWFLTLFAAGAWLGLSYRAGSWADGRETYFFLLGSVLLAPFSLQRLLCWVTSVGLLLMGRRSQSAVGEAGGGLSVLLIWAGMAAWEWRLRW